MISINLNDLKHIFTRWGFTWKGLINNQNGEWYLIGQLFIISLHLLPIWITAEEIGINPPISLSIPGFLIISIGIYLLVSSIYNLGKSLSPLPEPIVNSKFIRTGAYNRCRHPIYQSLLIISAGQTIYLESPIHLLLFIILLYLLKAKAIREEIKLREIHPGYNDYIKSTPAIFKKIPLLDWRS